MSRSTFVCSWVWKPGSAALPKGPLDAGPSRVNGRWQAERLVDAVREEGLTAIYSSDLARAWDTALAVARGSGVAPRVERGLCERHFGAFEGCTWDEIAERWPDLNDVY